VSQYFTDTVIEPYMELISSSIKNLVDFIPIISHTSENFQRVKALEEPQSEKVG